MEQSKDKLDISVDNFNILEFWNEGTSSIFEAQEKEREKTLVSLIMILIQS